MNCTHIPKFAYEYIPADGRNVVRPRNRWTETALVTTPYLIKHMDMCLLLWGITKRRLVFTDVSGALYLKTSVTKYRPTTRNVADVRRPHLHRDECLKSRKTQTHS